MFKIYGIIGALLILLVEINFIFKFQPFAGWYYPIVWIGYILLIDAIVYKIKGRSLITSKPFTFIGLFVISIIAWAILGWFNIFTQNWTYSGTSGVTKGGQILRLLKDSIIIPAMFETYELIRSLHLFDKTKLKKKHKIPKTLLYSLMALGVICFILPIFLPDYAFPLVWLSLFLLLDPINYLNKQPSIIRHLKDKKLVTPLSMFLSGMIVGLLWEFWNYWAIHKWSYHLPEFLSLVKIFEMPLLGYLGYGLLALELYAMYWFIRSLFVKTEKILK